MGNYCPQGKDVKRRNVGCTVISQATMLLLDVSESLPCVGRDCRLVSSSDCDLLWKLQLLSRWLWLSLGGGKRRERMAGRTLLSDPSVLGA